VKWLSRLFRGGANPESLREELPHIEAGFDASTKAARAGRLDEYSDTWVFVRNWAESELTKAREENDSFKRDDIQTAALRGRIKLLKELMELPLPPRKERQRPRPASFVEEEN
jgi:hypothetical protein